MRADFLPLRAAALLAAVSLVAGCATTTGAGRDPRDPFESFNRASYQFNDTLDKVAFKPIAQAYDFLVPDLVQGGVRNFLANLEEPLTIINDLLQGKGERALADPTRLLMNSSFGLVGIFDIATPAGLAKHNEDLGQTLGWWGTPSGPYLVLPFFGPSTVRDTAARPLDSFAQYFSLVEHVPTRNSLYALDLVQTRATLLAAGTVLQEAALDPYVFLRDAFLQRRQRDVYDGNPPKGKDDLDEEGDLEEEQEPQKPGPPGIKKPPGPTGSALRKGEL